MPSYAVPSKDKRSGYALLHGHVHLGTRKPMINHWTRTYMTTITLWHSDTIITIIKNDNYYHIIINIIILFHHYLLLLLIVHFCCSLFFFPVVFHHFFKKLNASGSSRSSGIFVFVALLTFDHRQDLLFPLFGTVPVGITHLAGHSPKQSAATWDALSIFADTLYI